MYIANYSRLQLCIYGAGHSVAFVMDNNLYYLPSGMQEAIPITTDGIDGIVYNGHTDWVYEGLLIKCNFKTLKTCYGICSKTKGLHHPQTGNVTNVTS
jgi:hypothetical protein